MEGDKREPDDVEQCRCSSVAHPVPTVPKGRAALACSVWRVTQVPVNVLDARMRPTKCVAGGAVYSMKYFATPFDVFLVYACFVLDQARASRTEMEVASSHGPGPVNSQLSSTRRAEGAS